MGQLLSIDPSRVEGNLAALTSCLMLCDQADKQALEALLARSQAECLMYLDLNKYDETPTLLTVKQPLAPHTAGQPIPAPSAPASSSAIASTGLVGEVGTVTKQATKTKLFAMEQGFAMLLKLPDAISEQLPPYLVLMGKSLSCLQALERTTASSLQTALQAGSVTGRGQLGFRLHCRLTTTDAASENFVAERLVMADRDESWSSIHLVCLVHQIAIAHSRTFSLMQWHISGMVNLSLVLATGSAMSTFRDHLAATVRERVRFLRGIPPAEATAYRNFILNLFCSTGRHRELRRFLLQALPNGDWRHSDVIEVYVPPGIAVDEEQLTRSVINGLVIALSGKVFTTYPQSRWIGCDVAVDEIGLCEAVHRLLFVSLVRMYGQQAQFSTADAAQDQEQRGFPLEPAAASTASAPAATAPLIPWHTQAQILEGGDVPEGAFGPSAEPHLADASAEAMAKRQRIALEWLATNPLPYLILLRLCLRPMTTLLRTYITRSGDRWEQQQRASEAQRLEQRHEENEQTPGRDYSFLDFVRGVAEQDFFLQMAEVRKAEHWVFIPRLSWHLEFQTLAFRLLSRMGCAIQQLLVQRAREFPAKLFRLLCDEDIADELLQCQDCCLDNFSKRFKETFAADGLASPDALACLEVLAMTASVDTVNVEWSHGRIQRILAVEGVQTHRPTLNYLNSQHICQKHQECKRRARGTALLPRRSAGVRKTESRTKAKKRPRGGGGAWRAFTSERLRGMTGPVDWSKLSEDYHAAQRANTPEYAEAVRVGAAATERHRASGQASFGPRRRALRRKRATAASDSLVGRAPTAEALSALQVDATSAEEGGVAVHTDTAQQITQVRKLVKSQAMERTRRDRQLALALSNWREAETGTFLEALLQVQLELASLAGCFS